MRLLLVISALMHFLSPSPVIQTDSISFSSNKTTADFPTTITFSTSITAENTIKEVELIYGVTQQTCGDVIANAFPEISPANQVEAGWEWDMRESGSLPPGAEIWWQWKAVTDKGETVTSERQTVTWIDAIHPWKMIEDGNLRLHTYQMSDARAAELLTAATEAEKRLNVSTGMTVKDPIDLYIYPNSNEMTDAILYEPGWTGGMAFSKFNKIILGAVLEDMTWTKRTVAHELTHILVGNYTFSCLWTTPTWLEEGLAVLGEGEPDANTVNQFDDAIKENRLLSFHILSASFSEDPNKADLSYSQSYYLVKYLTDTYGSAKINLLLTTLAKGTTVDDALKEVYGFNLRGFEQEWRDFYHLPETARPEELANETQTPTVIPTMHPVTGEFIPAATPISEAIESTRVSPADGSATAAPLIQVNPADGNFAPAAKVAIVVALSCLCLLAVLGLVIFLVIRSQNRKNKIIATFTILFLVSAGMSLIFGEVNGQSSQPTPYPQRPTATQYVPPKADAGTYSDPSAGISLDIPQNAVIDTTRASASYHFQISLSDNAVIGHLFSSPASANKTLEELAKEIATTETSDLQNINTLENKQIQLFSGKPGWLTVLEADQPDLSGRIRLSLMTTRNSTRAVTLLLYSSVDGFTAFRSEIDDLNNSILVSSPKLYGFTRDQILVEEGGETDNPQENDPATTRSSGGEYLVFSGLVSFDLNLNLVPELARSWEVSKDNLTYTFHLQPDARFHNNRLLTAEDVVYSWERAADPDTNSDTVLAYLGDIKGVKEMRAGTAEHISGLKIMDAHTLQVTLDAPVPYFLMKLTYPTGYVLDRENVAMGENWYRFPNGTGPYRLSRWEEKKVKIYEAFDGYYGQKPKPAAIIALLYQGTGTQLYEQGMIDFAGVYSGDLVRFTDPTEPLSAQLRSGVSLCTSYITLDVTRPPFDDLDVRQAFARSVDKEKFISVLMDGAGLPARGLYPPALPGYNLETKGLDFDPEKARTLLAGSTYGDREMPPIVITVAGYGSDVSDRISGLVQMWEETLGVTITVQNIEPSHYQEAIDSGKHGQLISEGWCADYPDPENFADVLFHSAADMNRANYSNLELDSLLEKARVEKDVNRRMEMYHQAEEIIINDVPAIFLAHSKTYTLVKPYIKGYVQSPMVVPLERYLSIDREMLNAGE